ncbi:uncharacterized protein LOC133885768 [Phragmites australis]|uniref:uncharacterized protein LOC133885768 n=1 Tax=Phragmites australis TaxID=29695 RepID=UPI002D78E7BC|nr:uncharacterized protein LOC133885768 [Phragmites australis]
MVAYHHLLLLLAVAAAGAVSTYAKPTAYVALAEFDFPPGILPKGVVAYTLDNATGAFTATLDASASGTGSSTCEFSIKGSYSLRYQTKITGNIAPNHLTNLQGVSVKVLFFWLNIIEVSRKGENLEFSVGIASADFGIDEFLECPTCGCGFDCNDLPLMLRKPGAGTAKLRLRGAF